MTDRPLVTRFDRLVAEEPHRALVYQPAGPTLTAADLADLAADVARRLDAIAAPAGAPVVTATGNRPEFIALALACFRTGRPLMPADPGTSLAAAHELAVAWRAAALVAPAVEGADAPDDRWHDGMGLWRIADTPARYDDVAVMKLTSGSTGMPKAVLASHANLAADACHLMAGMDVRADDVQLATIPLSHAYGFGNLVTAIFWQGTAIVLRDGFVPHRLAEDVARHGVRVWPGVPFMFEHVLQLLPEGGLPRCLEVVLSAGAPLEHDTQRRFLERFGLKIHSFYGASETGGITYDAAPRLGAVSTVGRPLPEMTIRLLPEDGVEAGTGRVHVSGPTVAQGYATLTPDAAEGFVNGGFLTGDIGRWDEDGSLVLVGRVSSFVNVAGRKVQPEEVARCLRQMPAVAEAHVLGTASALRGQELAAVIVPRGEAPAVAALRMHCAAHLAPHKVPRAFVIVGAIPVDVRGKVDRKALAALVAASVAAPGATGNGPDPGAILHGQSGGSGREEEGR